MGDSAKKALKAAAKGAKKQAKAEQKRVKTAEEPVRTTGEPAATGHSTEGTGGSSRLVRFAEGVRGVLFLIFAVSLVIAILLPDIGQTLGMSEIISKLIGHWAGKGVLVVIAVAFFIYGLKYLRAIK